MRVLFQNRDDALEHWGGDTTQMMETKNHLEKLGIHVDISLDTEPDVTNYDIVHIFNIQTAQYGIKQLLNAKQSNVPVALSPIYWDLRPASDSSRFHYHQSAIVRGLAQINTVIPEALSGLRGRYRQKKNYVTARRMLQEADILLPNSYAELEIIALLFDMPEVRGKAMFVPNGVSQLRLTEPNQPPPASIPKEYVLEVGRIEFVKGQLQVIKALYDKPQIPLVFVGRGLDSPYGKECIRLGEKRGNTFFVGEVAHDEVYSYYRGARVHVLPSLRESPGLASLEAAVFGANCVVSIFAPVAEYFGLDAETCNPFDLVSVREAVLKAWDSPRTECLRNRVLNNFTWNHAAMATLKAYEYILGASSME